MGACCLPISTALLWPWLCRQRFELSRVGEPPTEGTPEPQADTYRCSLCDVCTTKQPSALSPASAQAECFSGLLDLLSACLSSCLHSMGEAGQTPVWSQMKSLYTAALSVCRWARCNQALPLSYLHALGLPLPETQLAVWEPRLQWEELQVGPRLIVWTRHGAPPRLMTASAVLTI